MPYENIEFLPSEHKYVSGRSTIPFCRALPLCCYEKAMQVDNGVGVSI